MAVRASVVAMVLVWVGSVVTAQAKDKTSLPKELEWFQPAEVQASLQGKWRMDSGDILVVKGHKITRIKTDGTKQQRTLVITQPGKVSFMSADGSGLNHAYAVTGKTRHLYSGTCGVKHGDWFVAGDNFAGSGVVMYNAKTKACLSIPKVFGKWKPAQPGECSVDKKGGHTVFTYAYPDPNKKKADGTSVMIGGTLYLVGDALLDTKPGGDGNLVPAP